jgi:hypothetical protein
MNGLLKKVIQKELKIFLGFRTMALVLLFSLLMSCLRNNNEHINTYQEDLDFLKQYVKPVELTSNSGNSRIAIIPSWQGRVMTSTAAGNEGFSYGWINYSFIQSGKIDDHFNAFGGEERLWLGPEGGQFSLYFAPNTTQEIQNWNVPPVLDTEPFEVVEQTSSMISLEKEFELVNYSGTKFNIGIKRTVRLLQDNEKEKLLGTKLPEGVKCVSYRTSNVLHNKGLVAWTPDSGLISIWMLSMFSPSPSTTVFIPYKVGSDSLLGPIVSDDYFGKVPSNRIKTEQGIVYFKADGKYRSKIGISPKRAKSFSGSYDATNNTLTILWCKLPDNESRYVNSKWGIQKEPFQGDVINSYNDGLAEDGNQLGPFYELESSSPAAELSPGDSIVHTQSVFHFEGLEEELSKITEHVFGLSILKIKTAL